jgi:hypothetical protein
MAKASLGKSETLDPMAQEDLEEGAAEDTWREPLGASSSLSEALHQQASVRSRCPFHWNLGS